MPFKLPKKCRSYFSGITGKEESKLNILFDGYYLSLLVGLAQAKIDSEPDLEATAFIDDYPSDYMPSCDYIAGLLIATEAKRTHIDLSNSIALEKLMTQLLDAHTRNRLSEEGFQRLNQYASRGISVIEEKMLPHTRLEEFYQDYLGCFKNVFFKTVDG